MKKLILTIYLLIHLVTQVFSCSPLPWQSYCELMVYYDNIFLGEITETFDNGVSIELIEVFKGPENRQTITIWDGELGDCNGIPVTAYTSDYGDVGDTLVFGLWKPIQSIQLDWDVAGDYRKPDNTFGTYDFTKVFNNKVTVEGESYDYITYSYNDFVSFIYSGECVSGVNERAVCEGINDPFSLPWLVELTENNDEDCLIKNIVQFEREGITLFKADVIDCDIVFDKYYDCTGNLYCLHSAYPNPIPCTGGIEAAVAETGIQIWEYACTDIIDYEVTTPPFCVSDELFTVGITLNTTTRYILGENHLGKEVLSNRDKETFIGFRKGEGSYIINPKNNFTGCTTQDIEIEEPDCENKGSSCEIEDHINESPWLQQLIEVLSDDCRVRSDPNNIWSGYTLFYTCVDGTAIYEFQPPSCCDFQGFIYDASGSLLCKYGGLAGLSCPEYGNAYGVGAYFEEGEQLWSCYEICTLPAEPGPCEAYVPRYYYDAREGDCLEFIYGGCEGNANNFETYERCMQGCGYESRCAEVNNPLNKLWINNIIYNADGCAVGSLEQFEYNEEVYFQTVPYAVYPSSDCPSDLPTRVYDCLGNIVCTIGGYGIQHSKATQANSNLFYEECDTALTNASISNTTLLYNWGCEDPLELQIVQEATQDECIETIYAFEFENESYVYFDQVCPEFPDGDRYDELYNCNTGDICGRFLFGGYTTCARLYDKIKDLVKEENIIWSKNNNCAFEDPLTDLPWLVELIENAELCKVGVVEQFSYKGSEYIKVNPYYEFSPSECPLDLPFKVYNCMGDLVCTIGGYGLNSKHNLDECDPDLKDASNDGIFLWRYSKSCEEFFEFPTDPEIVQKGCVQAMYSFNYQNQSYLFTDQICEAVDGSDILYNCNTDETCDIGGFGTSLACDSLFYEISHLIIDENLVWSPPCNYENKGIVKNNGRCGFKIELDSGASIVPQYSDFAFYEDQSVELSYIEYPYRSECDESRAVKIICIREVETNSALFETYTWLNNIINTETCNGGATIKAYDYPGGNFTFLHVKEPNSRGSLYFQDGTLYCSDSPGYSCIEAYNLTQTMDSWTCNNPTIPPNNNELFDKYNWLNNYLNPETCKAINQIKEYDFGSYSFVYVEDLDGGKLYFEDGTFYCADVSEFSCLNLYGLDRPTASWTCENPSETCLVDNPLSLNWLEDLMDGNPDQGIWQFQYNGDTYFYMEPTVVFIDSGGWLVFDCEGNPVCYDVRDGSEESVLVCPFSIEAIKKDEEFLPLTSNSIFSAYPWINMLINQNTCVDTDVNIYNYGAFQFISINTNEGRNLYFQDGTFYCSDGVDYSCTDLYGLNMPVLNWSCGEVNQKQSKLISQQKIEFDVDFKTYPNPSNGQFTVDFNSQNKDGSQINIISLEGKLIQSIKIESNQNKVEVDLSKAAKGLYIIQLQNDTFSKTQRMIIH